MKKCNIQEKLERDDNFFVIKNAAFLRSCTFKLIFLSAAAAVTIEHLSFVRTTAEEVTFWQPSQQCKHTLEPFLLNLNGARQRSSQDYMYFSEKKLL
jgi:hypothetical protein